MDPEPPSSEKGRRAEVEHGEEPTHGTAASEHEPQDEDLEDFSWNYDVITNLLALYLIHFSSTWGMSIPSASIAFINYEFPSDTHSSAWIGAGPSLCLCVISIFAGDLSDMFGRKIFLVTSAALGFVGLLLGGLAKSMDMIIGGQILNGVGLSLGFLATPLLAEVVPKRVRGPIIAASSLLAGLVAVAGQFAQGAAMKNKTMGENRGWRLGFYLGAGFYGLAFATLSLFYHPGPRPNPEGYSVKARLLHLDWVGVFSGTAGLVLVLLGLQFGGVDFPWKSPLVISFLVVGILLLVALGIWEWRFPGNGLFPRSLFQHPNYAITMILNFIEGMVIFGSQAFLPQITLAMLTSDFVMSAVYNLPLTGGTIVGAIVAAFVLAKTKEAKWVAIAGVASLGLGGGLMALMKPGIHFAAWFFITAMIGAGMGILGVTIPVIASVCTPDRFIATAVAVGTSLRGLGGAVGLVVFTQVLTSKITESLPKKLATAAMAAGLPAESVPAVIGAFLGQDPAISEIPGVTDEVLAALPGAQMDATTEGFRFIWFSLIPFAAISLFITCFLKSTKQQMTLQVASRVQARHGNGGERADQHISEKGLK